MERNINILVAPLQYAVRAAIHMGRVAINCILADNNSVHYQQDYLQEKIQQNKDNLDIAISIGDTEVAGYELESILTNQLKGLLLEIQGGAAVDNNWVLRLHRIQETIPRNKTMNDLNIPPHDVVKLIAFSELHNRLQE